MSDIRSNPELSCGNEVDLIMFMGQSNMAGRGTAAEAPVVPAGAGFEFRAISDPTRLYPLMEPFGVHENNAESGVSESLKTGSLVSAFVTEYNRITGRTVVGVSCSKGGSSIHQWQPGGAFLTDAVARYQAASQWLKENGYTIRSPFMLWCQGETDGDNGMPQAEYGHELEAMIDAMIGVGLERCYLVRIGNHRDLTTLYDPIIAAQTELCRTYEHAVLVSVGFATMAASGLMKDPFHYTQQGYNLTGAEAGRHTAYHVQTGREPEMADPKSNTVYVSNKS